MSVATLIDIIIVICAVECVVLYAIHHSLAPLWGLALTVFHSKAAGRLWATERKQIEQVAERRVSQMVNESTNGGAPAPDSLIGSLTQQAGAAAETASLISESVASGRP